MTLDAIDTLIAEGRSRLGPAASLLPPPELTVAQSDAPDLTPDVAIGDPRLFKNLKGTREKVALRSGTADRGIQAPIRPSKHGLYPMTPKKEYIIQKVGESAR